LRRLKFELLVHVAASQRVQRSPFKSLGVYGKDPKAKEALQKRVHSSLVD